MSEKNDIEKLRIEIDTADNKPHKIKLSNTIKHKRSKILEYKRIIHIYKSIGDGLAFTYIDKYDIKPLSFKQNCGFLWGKKGLGKEIATLRAIFMEKRIALLNDITNCLKYGDITIPIEGFPLTIEVKSKKKYSKRNCRQEEGIKKVMDYLMNDETESLYIETGKMKRVSLFSQERNHLIELNGIIEKAYKDGACMKKVESGLYYYVAYVEEDEHIKTLIEEIESPCVFFINEFKYVTTGYYPLTLCINNPDRLLDLYAGNMLITVVVDLDYVREVFKKNGLILSHKKDEKFPFMVSGIDDSDGNYISFSEHFWGRIGCEFLSLDWFVNEILNETKNIEELTK
jgi:hypothetical protein